MQSTSDGDILFAPPRTSDPLDACVLTDLIVSLKTKTFHTPFEVSLKPQKRVSKSSNTFFCPVCPNTPITITKSPFMISCSSCKWNAADHGISTVSDLLLADSRPYHDLFQRIRVLGESLASRDPSKPGGWELPEQDEVNEIPLERRFDARVTRRQQEPARRRTRNKVGIAVNGVDIGSVENGVWKLKHPAVKVLPKIRISRSADATTLHVQNEHSKDIVISIGEEESTLVTGQEHEFIIVPDRVVGWEMVDMTVEHIDGVYCGSWRIRLFFKSPSQG